MEKKVVQQLQELRGGVAQKEIADRMGTSGSHVHRILAGDISITLGTLERFCEALGYSFKISFEKKMTPQNIRKMIQEFRSLLAELENDNSTPVIAFRSLMQAIEEGDLVLKDPKSPEKGRIKF